MDYIDDYMQKEYEMCINKNYEKKLDLKVNIIKDGYVLPANKMKKNGALCGRGGVLNDKLEYIENSGMLAVNMANRMYGAYEFNLENVEYIDEKVIYLNHFMKHWGHYLIDVIGRLWYVLKNDISEYKIVYSSELGKENYIKGNYLQLLNLLGIDEDKLIMVNKVTQFKEIIVPDSAIFPGKYFTKAYIEIFDYVVSKVEIKESVEKRIYCSRRNLKNLKKREIGEECIENVFAENGFKIVSLEKMTLAEQISLINSVDEIFTISGTLPHNILFAKEKIKLIILNKTYRLNRHQFLINQMRQNVNVEYVDINVSPLPVLYGNGPFIMKLTDNFKRYAEENNIIFNYSVNTNINIKEKFWYYFNYLLSYRGKIAKDDMVNFGKLRKFYKESQKKKVCK